LSRTAKHGETVYSRRADSANQMPRQGKKAESVVRKSAVKKTKPVKKEKPKPRKLTPEEIAEINRVKALEKQKRKEQRAAAMKLFWRRFLLFVMMFAVVFAASVGVFFLSLSMHSGADKRSFTYQIGENEKDAVTRKYKPDQLERNGVVYVDFSEISEMCGMAVTGDITEERFIVTEGDNDYVRFEIGTRYAVVNGVEIRLSSESYRINGRVFAPIDFVDTYLLGIGVSYDKDEKKVTVWRECYPLPENAADGTEPEPVPVSFLLKKAITSDTLTYE